MRARAKQPMHVKKNPQYIVDQVDQDVNQKENPLEFVYDRPPCSRVRRAGSPIPGSLGAIDASNANWKKGELRPQMAASIHQQSICPDGTTLTTCHLPPELFSYDL